MAMGRKCNKCMANVYVFICTHRICQTHTHAHSMQTHAHSMQTHTRVYTHMHIQCTHMYTHIHTHKHMHTHTHTHTHTYMQTNNSHMHSAITVAGHVTIGMRFARDRTVARYCATSLVQPHQLLRMPNRRDGCEGCGKCSTKRTLHNVHYTQ